VRGKGLGFLQEGIPLLWRWIGDETVMLVEVLGTWPVIAGIGNREEEQQITGEWNMERVELRRY